MPGPGVKEITHTVYTLHAVIGPVSSLQQSVYLLPVPCRQAAVPHRAPAQTETQTIICFVADILVFSSVREKDS